MYFERRKEISQMSVESTTWRIIAIEINFNWHLESNWKENNKQIERDGVEEKIERPNDCFVL